VGSNTNTLCAANLLILSTVPCKICRYLRYRAFLALINFCPGGLTFLNTFQPRRPIRSARPAPQNQEKHKINRFIIAREVMVIDEEGRQLGVLPTREAVNMAQDRGLDLVEVAPQAQPPVCKIMDYGKFKYREAKKEAEAKKKRTEMQTKELRIRYRTDVGDFETKIKHAREFLAEGDKVKFSMRFKGREIAFIELGHQKFDELVARLEDVATVDERSPKMGNSIHIVFAPKKS
jgi:translation initiation factor IF-3